MKVNVHGVNIEVPVTEPTCPWCGGPIAVTIKPRCKHGDKPYVNFKCTGGNKRYDLCDPDPVPGTPPCPGANAGDGIFLDVPDLVEAVAIFNQRHVC